MREIWKSAAYDRWYESLRDPRARARINVRIRRLQEGNPGQHRFLAGGIIELKIDYGPGYRVYAALRRDRWILLLIGGDKTTQSQDILNARTILEEIDP